MSERHQLIAFLALLGAIIILFLASAACLYAGKSVEAIGIGGVMTGLIGVLGSFRPQRIAPTGTTETGDVNVNKEPTP